MMTAKRTNEAAQTRPFRLLPLMISCALAVGAGSSTVWAASSASDQWAPGRILVQPKPGLSDDELGKILTGHGGKSIGKIDAINVHIVQLPTNVSEKAVVALLAKNPHLKFAELDWKIKPQMTTNDPYFSSAWHLTKIQAPTAWDTATGGGVTIAILDSGVDSSHPDFAGKLVSGWNFYDNNSNTADVYGHGTQVAGVAAAASNNSVGVTSVAGGANIMPIRVTDTSGMGYLSMMASGITWAADNGARVANLSFEAAGGYATVQNAAQYMKNKGGLVVTAAGNSGAQQTFSYSDVVVVVSATDSNDAKTSWSNFGDFVNIAAPGTGIWTTTNGGGYAAASGTSVASPVAAGVVALIMDANPSLGAAEVENVLFSTAQDLGTAGKDTYYGYGRVNAAAAAQSASSYRVTDTAVPTVAFASPSSGATVKGLTSISVNASDNVGVTKVELRANGNLVATDIASPFGFSWDSTTVPDGAASLVAYAYDAAGNYSTATISVKVSNTADTTPPTAAIKNPGANSKVSGSVSVSASATDNVSVAKVALFIDGSQVATANGSSVSYNWNTRKAAAGNHTLKVDATDAAGNVGSQTIQVTK